MEHGELVQLIGYGFGAFVGGVLIRIGWIRAKGAKGLPSIAGDEPNGIGNGAVKNGSIGRDEFNDVLLEMGELKRQLGKVEGRLESVRHCDHCYRRTV